MAFKNKSDGNIRDHRSLLPDVDSHSISKDDYSHTPDSPCEKMSTDRKSVLIIALKAAIFREKWEIPLGTAVLGVPGSYLVCRMPEIST